MGNLAHLVSGTAKNRHDSRLAGRAEPQPQQALPRLSAASASRAQSLVRCTYSSVCAKHAATQSPAPTVPKSHVALGGCQGSAPHVTRGASRTIWPGSEPTQSPCINMTRHLGKQSYIFHSDEINL